MRAGMFGKKIRRGEQDFYLQITSMIDTLVIILVFMLMTLGSDNVAFEPASGITLPWSTQGSELAQGLKLIAKPDGVYLDQEKIAPLEGGITNKAIMAEAGRKIVPLFQKLAALAQESKKAAGTKVKFEGKILFQADKNIPLKTIKQILYTSARAGYNDFKFAVVRQ